MTGPGVGNPQDSEEEQRHRLQEYLAQQEANEADAASLEAVRNGGTATAPLLVKATYNDPEPQETATFDVVGSDPIGSPCRQERCYPEGDGPYILNIKDPTFGTSPTEVQGGPVGDGDCVTLP